MSDSFKLIVTAISNLVVTPASKIAMVYPNLASAQLVLEFATLPTINLNFQLVSPSGKVLSSTNGRNKVNVIDVSKLESENYFIRVIGKKYDQVKKYKLRSNYVMKKLLYTILFLSLFSCKKEAPEQKIEFTIDAVNKGIATGSNFPVAVTLTSAMPSQCIKIEAITVTHGGSTSLPQGPLIALKV